MAAGVFWRKLRGRGGVKMGRDGGAAGLLMMKEVLFYQTASNIDRLNLAIN
jgi:hypothetical protein